jgi:hypothetical protein
MNANTRREFLEDIGRGMLTAALGSAAALQFGAVAAAAEAPARSLTFGKLEPLVALMQETPPEKLMPALVGRLRNGVELGTLTAAAALANARAFGGHDYTGYHTFMALMPAYRMSGELPTASSALPVLKVIYRNASRIQDQDAARRDALHHHDAAPLSGAAGGDALRTAIRALDRQGAESRLTSVAAASPRDAFEELQAAIEDQVNVHRVVLAWRAWAMLELAGQEHAATLLRQSVHFCLDEEQQMHDRNHPEPAIRALLPRLLDEHHLLAKPLGDRPAEDGWLDGLAHTIFSSSPEQAAAAAAAALAEGMHPDAVGKAMALAANLLVLHDPGRRQENSTPEKPAGCVHGDSVGVHASDAANAWRNIARVASPRSQAAALIVGAYHTAGQLAYVAKEPYPYAAKLDELQGKDAPGLLGVAEEAILANDQAAACAAIHRYGELDAPSRPVFDLLLKYAVSEDGALHAEKYYRTVSEEFADLPAAFRWRELVALARVTASEHGYPAPGVEQARELLAAT